MWRVPVTLVRAGARMVGAVHPLVVVCVAHDIDVAVIPTEIQEEAKVEAVGLAVSVRALPLLSEAVPVRPLRLLASLRVPEAGTVIDDRSIGAVVVELAVEEDVDGVDAFRLG